MEEEEIWGAVEVEFTAGQEAATQLLPMRSHMAAAARRILDGCDLSFIHIFKIKL